MTLTNEDLLAISELLDVKLDSKLKAELQPVKDELRDLNVKVDRMDQRLDRVEERLDQVEERLDRMEERQDRMEERLDQMDHEIAEMKQNVGKLSHEIAEVKQSLGRTDREIVNIRLHLENVTDKNIQLLAENYVPAAKRYEKVSSQIEAQPADMDIMKKVIADHSRKLQALGLGRKIRKTEKTAAGSHRGSRSGFLMNLK